MPGWGLDRTDSFAFGGGDPALPAAFTVDGSLDKVFHLPAQSKRTQFVLYVSYSKGTETGLEVRIAMKKPGSDTTYYEWTQVRPNTGAMSVIRPVTTVGGNFRIAVPLVPGETVIRVAVRDSGLAGGDGTGTLIPATEED